MHGDISGLNIAPAIAVLVQRLCVKEDSFPFIWPGLLAVPYSCNRVLELWTTHRLVLLLTLLC